MSEPGPRGYLTIAQQVELERQRQQLAEAMLLGDSLMRIMLTPPPPPRAHWWQFWR